MTYEEAKQQMRRGDWVLVAQMVGVTFQYARNLSNRGTHLSAELYPGFFYEEDGEILDHAMRARYEAGERVELQMVVGPDGQVHQLYVEQ